MALGGELRKGIRLVDGRLGQRKDRVEDKVRLVEEAAGFGELAFQVACVRAALNERAGDEDAGESKDSEKKDRAMPGPPRLPRRRGLFRQGRHEMRIPEGR